MFRWPLPDKAVLLSGLPGGTAGTRATLALMAKLAREAKTDPRIRTLAAQIAAGYPRDYRAQASAICEWVRTHVSYVRDVAGVETVTPPAYLLGTLAGDCDDSATLVAALLQSVGIGARFVAGGRDAERLSHVWCEAYTPDGWFACETTMPTWQPGRVPALPFRLVVNV